MRVCVFVDGENFRHSIVELFPDFKQEDYLPKSANWAKLFDWIVKGAVEDGERIRTYWYVIESLNFSPYKFPNLSRERETLWRVLSRHEPYEKELVLLEAKDCDVRMQEIVNELVRRRENMRRRFDGWTAIQNGISQRHKAIEFRRAGTMMCNLFDNELGSEKAVDVKLACDMIILKDIYDVAVIVSGDQDYVPAVEILKDYGKWVVNVAFRTRGGKLLPGGARRLNQSTDWSYEIPYQPFAERLGFISCP